MPIDTLDFVLMPFQRRNNFVLRSFLWFRYDRNRRVKTAGCDVIAFGAPADTADCTQMHFVEERKLHPFP